MYDSYLQSVSMYHGADQLSLSLRAAETAKLMQAVRDRKRERRAARRQRRALRRGQEAYTTAV